MFNTVPLFACPLCHTKWRDQNDAENCREDCASELQIEFTSGYACLNCDIYFDSKEDFWEHLLICKTQNCTTCEHCDLEGRRSGPCRQYNNAPITSTCEDYERAYK